MIKKYGLSSIISFASALLILLGLLMSMSDEFDLDIGILGPIVGLIGVLFMAISPLIALGFGFYAIFRKKLKNIFSYTGFTFGAISLFFFLYVFI